MKIVTIKALSVTLLFTMLLGCAVACGSQYGSDVAAPVVLDAMIASLESKDSPEYYVADDETYAVYFDTDEAYTLVQDCCIAYHNVGTNVDQFGVFRVKDGQSVEPVRRMVQTYVDGQAEYLYGFASNYQRDELDKIEGAHVEVYGQYVVYTILSSADRASATDALTAAIAE
jgi:hypothetical protein